MLKKNGEKITIDQLAIIINKGFDGQMEYMKKEFEVINKRFDQVATKDQFKSLDTRLNVVEKDVKEIKTVLTDAHVL